MIDPALFDAAAVSDEIRAQNATILARLAALPEPSSVPPSVIRERRRQGLGPFPDMPLSAHAKVVEIDGPAGPIPLRDHRAGGTRGRLFHIHGGGWTWGTADEQDPWLDRLAERCGSRRRVGGIPACSRRPLPGRTGRLRGGRLMAVWVRRSGFSERIGFSSGANSAGAHLASLTLLRLRGPAWSCAIPGRQSFCRLLRFEPDAERGELGRRPADPQHRATFGCSPITSAVGRSNRRDPDDFAALCRSQGVAAGPVFGRHPRTCCWTTRCSWRHGWASAGNPLDLAVWPGGCHVFIRFDSALSEQALSRIDGFLTAL